MAAGLRYARLSAIVAVGLLFCHGVQAEPYLAVRYGYKCSQCHLNPSGGGKRNRFGTVFSQTELPSRTLSSADISRLLAKGWDPGDGGASKAEGEGGAASQGAPAQEDGSLFYSGYVADFLGLGGDFRFTNRTAARPDDNSVSNTFDVSEGNLYASLELFGEALTLYLDETVAPGGAASREAYVLLRGPWTTYAKAGRMMLPYGLRLQDDTAFIREITGFNYGVQDLGVELGFEPGPFSVSVALSNGTQGSTDNNREKQVSAVASFIQRHWRVGTQATYNDNPGPGNKRVATGGFLGLHLGKFSLLGEVDYVVDELGTTTGVDTERLLLAYGSINYLATRGLNLFLGYDYADPDLSESEDSFTRLSVGAEYFPVQFTQLRLVYRFRDEASSSPRDNESELLAEIHLFF